MAYEEEGGDHHVWLSRILHGEMMMRWRKQMMMMNA